MIPIRVKWETIVGATFEGMLVEVDNGTAIIQMDDGTKKATDIDCLELAIPHQGG